MIQQCFVWFWLGKRELYGAAGRNFGCSSSPDMLTVGDGAKQKRAQASAVAKERNSLCQCPDDVPMSNPRKGGEKTVKTSSLRDQKNVLRWYAYNHLLSPHYTLQQEGPQQCPN